MIYLLPALIVGVAVIAEIIDLEMLRTHHHKNLTGSTLREAGWNALVKDIGLVNAARFILQYEAGYGDYTKTRKEVFKGKTVNDLCKEIEKFEKRAVR